MKTTSFKTKITLVTAILTTLGLTIMVISSVLFIKKNITETMIQQFINENSQIADQAGFIVANGGSVETLQTFVEKKVATHNHLAYAIVIDKTVTAVAHSDKEKIGKNYSDDTAYTVPASTEGTVMTSRFWADVQKSWTYDIMCPIYVNGSLYGSMDVGIYDSTVNNVVNSIRNIQILIAVIMILLICGLILVITHKVFKPLIALVVSINHIAEGYADLAQRVNVTSNDEIGKVIKGFNTFIEKLHFIVTEIKTSKKELEDYGADLNSCSEDTSSSLTEILANIENVNKQIITQSDSVNQTAGNVNEIASNIVSLEKMIENQAASVTQASAAVEQMIGNIGTVNHSVGLMSDSFKELEGTIVSGTKKQEDANQRISEIEGQSQMLQEANFAIASIANQTNLLAMNAAIEAAHAGTAGKGFSVVADEIRKLSETSAAQSKKIGAQLKVIKSSIGNVVEASAESITAFHSISDKISQTGQLVDQITSAMEEQTTGSKQILDSLHGMSESTEEVRNASHEMTEGNQSILSEIKNLQDSSFEMKGSVTEMDSGAHVIHESTSSLMDISSKMKESIEKIGKQIDKFRI